jgi:hypothetical protein
MQERKKKKENENIIQAAFLSTLGVSASLGGKVTVSGEA